MTWTIVFATLFTLAATPAMGQNSAVTLEIDKMNCAACPITVRVALERVAGAMRAKVDYRSKLAVVKFDAGRTSPAALARASTDAGYPARVKEERQR